MFLGPWGASSFRSFYESLYPEKKPIDLNQHSEKIYNNLKEEGRLSALRSTFLASKPKSAESISLLKTKNTIVMGDKDPDFDDPIQEAKRLSLLTKGEFMIFTGSGHYPYKDNPKQLSEIIREIWKRK